ncbi:MAG: hypothetical protein WCL06_01145 [Bacteroidota bacterium]
MAKFVKCEQCGYYPVEFGYICTKCGAMQSKSNLPPTQLKTEQQEDSEPSVPKTGKKRKIIKLLVIIFSSVLICLCIVFAIFYFIQKNAWDEAKQKNTYKSYQTYLSEYPDGRYIEDARKELNIIQRAIDDSISKAKAIQDSISAVELSKSQTNNNILGIWIGKFSNKIMQIAITEVNQSNIIGYDILNGKKRSLSGTFTETNVQYTLLLNEPGDDKGDGKFDISINKSNLAAQGTWQSFKGNLKYSFNFNKIGNISEISESIYELLIKTSYKAMENNTFDAADYFSSRVDVYNSMKNTTPQKINNYVNNSLYDEYSSLQYAIPSETYSEEKLNNGSTKIVFNEDFTGYRKSEEKYHDIVTKTEVIFNKENKISSWKQLEIINDILIDPAQAD